MKFEAEVTLKHIPSVNQAHLIGRSKSGKAWIYLNPEIANMQDKIKQDLIIAGAYEKFSEIRNHPDKYIFDLDLIFILKERLWLRDVSNFIKYVEDAIFRTIGLNDNHVVRVTAHKVLNSTINHEKINIVLITRNKDEL